jgi:hypothetical protein
VNAVVYGAHAAIAKDTILLAFQPEEAIVSVLTGAVYDLHNAAVQNEDDVDWSTLRIETHVENMPLDPEWPQVLFRFTVDGSS